MKKYQMIQIVVFLVPLYLLLIVSLISPKEAISQTENRTLATLPRISFDALVSGQFMNELEQYYSDHFAFRDPFIRIGRAVNRWSGIPTKEQVVIVSGKGNNMLEEVDYDIQSDIHSDPKAVKIEKGDTTATSVTYENVIVNDEIESEAESPSQPLLELDDEKDMDMPEKEIADMSAEPAIAEQVRDQYLLVGDEAMILYRKNERAIEEYLQVIHEYREALDPEVYLYTMVIPTKAEFLQEKRLKELSDSQWDVLQHLHNNLESTVTFVDVYENLSKHRDEYIYFRTDHHWTALGAYYGYSAFTQYIGDFPTPLEDFKEDFMEGFLGSLYFATLSKELEQNPDTIELYIPQTPHEYHIFWYDHYPLPRKIIDKQYAKKHGNDYAVFLEGDYPWGRIRTDYAEDRKMAIIKDSYGNAFVPFLIPHFSEIYIIDPRYFKTQIVEFIEANEINHVLFLNNIAVTSQTGYADLLQAKM